MHGIGKHACTIVKCDYQQHKKKLFWYKSPIIDENKRAVKFQTILIVFFPSPMYSLLF